MHRATIPCTQGILVTALLLLTGAAAAAQDGSYDAPRTSWGHPNIDGVWDFRSLTPLERPFSAADQEVFSAEEAEQFREQVLAARDVDQRRGQGRIDVESAYNSFWWDWGDSLTDDKRTSLIVDPPNGRLPPITEAEKKRRAATAGKRQPPVLNLFSLGDIQFDGPEYLGLSERCLVGFNAGPPMLPSAYNNNLRIVQTPDHVVLLNEMIHDARVVPIDGSPHLPGEIKRWMGDSVGRWEGATLVVETTNFTDKKPTFQTLGAPYGSDGSMLLVERFTRVAEDRLLYEFTLDDPETFTQSFTAAIPMKASDAPLYEYACHEGNYAMGGVLRGARLADEEAKQPTSRP